MKTDEASPKCEWNAIICLSTLKHTFAGENSRHFATSFVNTYTTHCSEDGSWGLSGTSEQSISVIIFKVYT